MVKELSLDEFREYIDGPLVLVGNALSLLDHQYGPLIDSYKHIWRFNSGIPVAHFRSLGRRTTIHSIINNAYWKNRRLAPEGCVQVIPEPWPGRRHNHEYNRDYTIFPRALISGQYEECGYTCTAGYLYASWLCAEGIDFDLIGFDFNATGRHCGNTTRNFGHRFQQEREDFSTLIHEYSLRHFQTA